MQRTIKESETAHTTFKDAFIGSQACPELWDENGSSNQLWISDHLCPA